MRSEADLFGDGSEQERHGRDVPGQCDLHRRWLAHLLPHSSKRKGTCEGLLPVRNGHNLALTVTHAPFFARKRTFLVMAASRCGMVATSPVSAIRIGAGLPISSQILRVSNSLYRFCAYHLHEIHSGLFCRQTRLSDMSEVSAICIAAGLPIFSQTLRVSPSLENSCFRVILQEKSPRTVRSVSPLA